MSPHVSVCTLLFVSVTLGVNEGTQLNEVRGGGSQEIGPLTARWVCGPYAPGFTEERSPNWAPCPSSQGDALELRVFGDVLLLLAVKATSSETQLLTASYHVEAAAEGPRGGVRGGARGGARSECVYARGDVASHPPGGRFALSVCDDARLEGVVFLGRCRLIIRPSESGGHLATKECNQPDESKPAHRVISKRSSPDSSGDPGDPGSLPVHAAAQGRAPAIDPGATPRPTDGADRSPDSDAPTVSAGPSPEAPQPGPSSITNPSATSTPAASTKPDPSTSTSARTSTSPGPHSADAAPNTDSNLNTTHNHNVSPDLATSPELTTRFNPSTGLSTNHNQSTTPPASPHPTTDSHPSTSHSPKSRPRMISHSTPGRNSTANHNQSTSTSPDDDTGLNINGINPTTILHRIPSTTPTTAVNITHNPTTRPTPNTTLNTTSITNHLNITIPSSRPTHNTAPNSTNIHTADTTPNFAHNTAPNTTPTPNTTSTPNTTPNTTPNSTPNTTPSTIPSTTPYITPSPTVTPSALADSAANTTAGRAPLPVTPPANATSAHSSSTSRTPASTPSGYRSLGRTPPESRGLHVELVVVAGADVWRHHGEDTQRYLLTNINIAAELLRLPSLGRQIHLHVVRLLLLGDSTPVELAVTENVTSSLTSFCRWHRSHNPADDSHPDHADLALYVTRQDLVGTGGLRAVRGAAQLGGACSPAWSCLLAEDTGFDLGVTVAHEIGHSLGITHDGEENDCGGGGGYIMAVEGAHASLSSTWSRCSRKQLLRFLSSGEAWCLSDAPPAPAPAHPPVLPGLRYGADEQCRVMFGHGATACSFSKDDKDVCSVLSCHTHRDDFSSCTRLHISLLDGTPCADHRRCVRGVCVPFTGAPSVEPVHGAWSAWGRFGDCSRTCGGGVTVRTRRCNSPRPALGGKTCDGTDVEAVMCNRQPCASSSQFSFAVEQCSNASVEPSTTTAAAAAAAAAGTRSALRYHAWAPSMVRGDWRCQYRCETVGRSLRVSRGAAFVDGTRCEHPKEPALGLCVSGRCQEFGCDGVLGSGVLVDACGTCGGDGSSCYRINGTFHGGEAKKYVTFLRVPLNATSVHVSNTRSAYTHLALLVGRVPVVAGRGSVSTNVSVPSALEDERLTYRLYLTELKIPRTERLSIPGPVTQPTHVQVYRRYGREYGRAADPDIVFSFHLPHGQPLYQWEERRAPCSHTCGTGTTRAAHVCVDPSLGSEVPPERCLLSGPRPLERTVPCSRSLEPCPAPPHEVTAKAPASDGDGDDGFTSSSSSSSSSSASSSSLAAGTSSLGAASQGSRGGQGGSTTPSPMTSAPPVTPTTKTPLVTTQAAHDAAPSTEFSTPTTPSSSSSSSSASSFSTSSAAPQLPASCGLQVTAPAGVVRLDARPGVDCSVAFARPLGEVVSVHVLQHNMECSAGDYAMVLERLSWRRFCEGSRNTTLSSRTNNLIVRLRAAGGRRGLRVAFAARRARRPQHRECDVQLTGTKGRIGAPQAVAGGAATQPCRAYINVPPSRRIVLRAMLTSGGGRGGEQDGPCDGQVVVRDMETLKAVPVCGPRPLVWKSSGSRAEIEFHGRLNKQTSSFIALYRAIDPGAPLSGT